MPIQGTHYGPLGAIAKDAAGQQTYRPSSHRKGSSAASSLKLRRIFSRNRKDGDGKDAASTDTPSGAATPTEGEPASPRINLNSKKPPMTPYFAEEAEDTPLVVPRSLTIHDLSLHNKGKSKEAARPEEEHWDGEEGDEAEENNDQGNITTTQATPRPPIAPQATSANQIPSPRRSSSKHLFRAAVSGLADEERPRTGQPGLHTKAVELTHTTSLPKPHTRSRHMSLNHIKLARKPSEVQRITKRDIGRPVLTHSTSRLAIPTGPPSSTNTEAKINSPRHQRNHSELPLQSVQRREVRLTDMGRSASTMSLPAFRIPRKPRARDRRSVIAELEEERLQVPSTPRQQMIPEYPPLTVSFTDGRERARSISSSDASLVGMYETGMGPHSDFVVNHDRLSDPYVDKETL